MLKCSFTVNVKVNITIDSIRLKSNLKINQLSTSTKRSSFHTILGITQNRSGPLSDIEGFVQLVPATYKSDKPANSTGLCQVPLKSDCVNGSIQDGVRQPIL